MGVTCMAHAFELHVRLQLDSYTWRHLGTGSGTMIMINTTTLANGQETDPNSSQRVVRIGARPCITA
jgi:hypothetical protein